MNLALFNSLTRKREVFSPINDNLIKMYVCGPTVYDHPHIGNARSVVVYDLLYRILIKLYGFEKVKYVRNITDIDDKIINRAKEQNISISELTTKTIDYFNDDMSYLNCLSPNIEPKATEHVQEMIDIISLLLKNGFAYESENHIYFDVTKYSDYTKLSGRSFDDMFENVRIENGSGKKNSGDFVLWKPSSDSQDTLAKFESSFGIGRPGWHIECSAMSHKYLGEDFDIHGGGADLIFPHHTNEMAQTCCAFPGAKFAKFWVHNGFLTVNNEKMSKSLGNFTTVKDLRSKGIKGETARLFLLSNHYRKPIDYNDKAISDAEKTLSYWYRAVENMEIDNIPDELPDDFFMSLLEDMNISNAIKIINQYAKQVYLFTKNEDLEKKKLAASRLLSSARFLGLMENSSAEWFGLEYDTDDIDILIKERLEAKLKKDWELADQIREKLLGMNIEIEDMPGNATRWRKKPNG